MDIQFNPDGSLRLPWREHTDERISYRCVSCGKLIRRGGFCIRCNIKKKTHSTDTAEGKARPPIIVSGPKFISIFPYPAMRGPQREMIDDVRNALVGRRHLIADAPTGLGKTIAALYPSLAFAISNNKTVLFLTSRVSQHRAAIDTLKAMKAAGSSFSAVDMVGKRHLCSHDVEGMDSSMFVNFCTAMIKDKRCKFYTDFRDTTFRNERSRLISIVASSGPMSSQEAMALMSERFCSYEMQMDAAGGADVIVADYFHVFGNGGRSLVRMGKELKDCIIIVDEAHNLAARLRGQLSARISTLTCDRAMNEARDEDEPELLDRLKKMRDSLRNMGNRSLFGEKEAFVNKDSFTQAVEESGGYNELIGSLAALGGRILEKRKVSSVARIAEFLDAWDGDDYGFARILAMERIRGEDHIALQYNCLDPSLISKNVMQDAHSVILMSGTLSPMEMHRDLLGMDAERSMLKSYASPFPAANRKNIIVSGITTRYKERTPENFSRIAEIVAKCVEAIKGNAAVFFPSYEMRDRIFKSAITRIKKHTILESSRMTKSERDLVRDEMACHAGSGAVIFGVLGGSFSEGIDLPGDLLNGVVVVGLPLERPSLSSKALIDYYQQRFGRGMEYGYVYPALIKVMQAAGRCIRTETDRGVIVFADGRFLWPNYRSVFPSSWAFATTTDPEAEIKEFFAKKE